MTAPPVLTPERIDAMLSIVAEVCLESVVEAGQRQKAADDVEAFERAGRTLERACRNLRQTIAMKQRFDREEARKACDARKLAAGVRAEAERARDVAVAQRRARVQAHFSQVLWNEYEACDAEELFDEVGMRLRDLAFDDDFLDTPVETLIRRLADDIGLGEEPHEPEPADEAPPPVEPPAPAAVSAPPPPDPEPEPPDVRAEPDPPPDPPPKPYLPPWEQLKPGQVMPGGSGW